MIHQMAQEKIEKRNGFLGRFRIETDDQKELRRDLGFLSIDYEAVSRIAANLSSHTKWIPYPFLQNRIRKLADELRSQSELIRIKITELGGKVPQVFVENRELLQFRQNVARLVGDMEEHAGQFEIFVHQRNVARDPGVVALFGTILKQMEMQKEELTDIVMRLS